MREEKIYIADDGKEFKFRYECQVYEDELHAPRRKVLEDYILFFYGNNTRAPYSPFREPSFVYVKQIPDEDNPVKEIWDEVISDDLNYAIECANKTGWYIHDDYERWQSVEKKKENLEKIVMRLEKVYEENKEGFDV